MMHQLRNVHALRNHRRKTNPKATCRVVKRQKVKSSTLANVEAAGQLPTSLVHDGCGCHGANHFTGLATMCQEQLTSMMSSREVDRYMMGLLAAHCRKSDSVYYHTPVASTQDRRRITFVYTCMGNLVCRAVFLKIHMIGTTRLKRLQKEMKNDSCNPGQHGNFGKEAWNIFPEVSWPAHAIFSKRPCASGPNVFTSVM